MECRIGIERFLSLFSPKLTLQEKEKQEKMLPEFHPITSSRYYSLNYWGSNNNSK